MLTRFAMPNPFSCLDLSLCPPLESVYTKSVGASQNVALPVDANSTCPGNPAVDVERMVHTVPRKGPTDKQL